MMHTPGLMRILIIACFALVVGRSMAAPLPAAPDSVVAEAVRLLENTLDLLRSSRDLGPFKHRFPSMAAQHPCDICPKVEPIPIEDYVGALIESGRDTFEFRHRVDVRHIRVEHNDAGRVVRVWIPFTKWVVRPFVKDTASVVEQRRLHLLAKVLVAPDGELSMETIVEELSPGKRMTLAEVTAGVMMGRPTFDAEGFSPDHSATRYTIGLVRYFHPFPTPNRSNIWLKVGLRLAWSNMQLTDPEQVYEQKNVALSPAYTPDSTLDHRIDLAWKVHGLKERISTVAVEVPLGVSKRWKVGGRTVLALDLGGNVGYELARELTGGYRLDQHGTNHTIDGQVMRGSNGQPVVYDSPDAAVVDASGNRIDFFTDRSNDLDRTLSKGGLFAFGTSPSLLVSNKRGGLYRIGLELLMVKTRTTEAVNIDGSYFRPSDESDRPALSDLSKAGFKPWLSLVLALQL